MNKFLKKFSVILIMIFCILFTFGCNDSEEIKRDVVPKLIDKIVIDTQKSILEKDVELARKTWSKVTEYSVKANEYDDKELSDALSKLAITYVKLIEYCESGEESFLKLFNLEFAKALDIINNVEIVVENTQALKPVFLYKSNAYYKV